MIQASNGSHYPQTLAVSAPVLLPGTSTQHSDHNSIQACTSPDEPSLPTPQSNLDGVSLPRAAVPETDRHESHTGSLVVIAGKAIKLDNSNRNLIAKLPVAFGFSLDDVGRSKALALAATQNWYNNGKRAASIEKNRNGIQKESTGTKNATSKGKHGAMKDIDKSRGNKSVTPKTKSGEATDKSGILKKKKTKQGMDQAGKKSSTLIGTSNNVSANGTPKSSSGTSPAGTSAQKPKTSEASPGGRVSATLISSSDSPPGLPNGWTMKTFKRMSGKTSGTTDSYWYSPQLKYKFRTKKSCNLFIEILHESGIDGDESVAFNAFKKRGFRV